MAEPTMEELTMYQALERLLPREQLEPFLAVFGGRAWHLPLRRPQTIEERDAAIYQAWNGLNRGDVCRRFHLSKTSFYRIIRAQLLLRRK